jgi:hypothetical protein
MRNSLQSMGMVFASAMAACSASAQVKISMPPPPPHAAAGNSADDAPPATVQTTGTTAAMIADVPAVTLANAAAANEGDLALARYARARSGTYDTYSNDGTYWNNGIRYISYPNYIPQFVWGPFWGGWGGFPFNGCW